MNNVIHIDEKRFYIKKIKTKFYLCADEDIPHQTTRNKNYIDKVMFLCADMKPRYGPYQELILDGKIGIFPLIRTKNALRSSLNYPVGAEVIESITIT